LTTVLVATWLLQSCTSDQPDFADGSQDGNCATASPNAGSAPTAVRVGVTGTLSEAAQYLAQAQGYFAGQGLKVQFINFTSATRMIPALASGQLEVGSGNVGPGLFNPPESNLCVKVVGSLARQEANANGVFLFVRRDLADAGKLRDYADLRGLHVALPGRNTTSEYALAKELETGGLTLKDVRIVQMSFPTMLVSLANKSIDVAMLPESLASAAADKNLGVKWKPVSEVLPGAEFGVVLFSPRFAAKRDAAVRWMSAYLQGARDYDDAFFHNQRRADVVAQLTKASPIKDAHLYDEMGFPLIDPNGNVNLDSIDDQMNWFIKAGELREGIDLAQVVDPSFAHEAVARLGSY
jgi:ABC-type nitrate/sulfonate/bicarbonate transport system substrate-binding protein